MNCGPTHQDVFEDRWLKLPDEPVRRAGGPGHHGHHRDKRGRGDGPESSSSTGSSTGESSSESESSSDSEEEEEARALRLAKLEEQVCRHLLLSLYLAMLTSLFSYLLLCI